MTYAAFPLGGGGHQVTQDTAFGGCMLPMATSAQLFKRHANACRDWSLP
ncbi:hypothetical protein [Acidithiobacillus ferrivorans]|nr:hypothetical protein [Acidithiobacillus ferrivorans]